MATLLLCIAAATSSKAETVVKEVLKPARVGANLLVSRRWRPSGKGFARSGDTIVCDNAGNARGERGAWQPPAYAR
jgi:hypothetical protein